ncbi:hypothetical protein PoB_004564200 [Plakobranchus ocellatus]|uniref:Uncharacterized protein n=1 Tax=Plakobranchus ocellatus TaxID=259542 RepID=A0AAV4BIC9_9GAST|nr:hypothetical protein PoB_004564200 [Plakobranchus ocellatus]
MTQVEANQRTDSRPYGVFESARDLEASYQDFPQKCNAMNPPGIARESHACLSQHGLAFTPQAKKYQ